MAIAHTHGTAITRDGLMLYQQSWQPQNPRARVLLVHGIAEYSERHSATAQFLAGQGIAVHSFDLRGHGYSEGDRAFITSFQDYLDDLDGMVQWAQSEEPELPLFLLGHSLGGAIATRYLLQSPYRQSQLAGLILSAPALVINEDVPALLLTLSALISRLLPKLPTILLERDALSRDRAVVDAYALDPLVYHGKWLARTGAEVVKAIREIQTGMSEIRLPLLLMHGTGDRIIPARASQMLYDQASSGDKTLKLYEGLYHELFNEPERSQVWADLNQWLQAHG